MTRFMETCWQNKIFKYGKNTIQSFAETSQGTKMKMETSEDHLNLREK